MTNEKIKVCALGAEGFTNQIDRIRRGFQELGHELVNSPENADLLYVNNPPFGEYRNVKCKKIFNVLDIPEHLLHLIDLEDYKRQLLFSDKVTCISNTVAAQIKKFCDIDATVIYNPMKDVKPGDTHEDGHYKFLYVGRANDPNKRFSLVKETLIRLGYNRANLAVCGSENPRFGTYLGIVTDEELSYLYNSCRYVFLPSKFEGIGLPAIEGARCMCIPILVNDNPTAHEFFPNIYNEVNPDPNSMANFIFNMENNYLFYSDILAKIYTASLKHVDNFSSQSVAKAIIKTYDNISSS